MEAPSCSNSKLDSAISLWSVACSSGAMNSSPSALASSARFATLSRTELMKWIAEVANESHLSWTTLLKWIAKGDRTELAMSERGGRTELLKWIAEVAKCISLVMDRPAAEP